MASNSALVTVTRAMPMVTPGPVAPLAEAAAEALRARSHTVAVFESTTGGLIQAALQAVPGASVYTTCGAVTYHSSRAVAVLGSDMSAPRASTGEGYVNAKKQLTARIARRMRGEVGAQWCISESGACGPTFNVTDISTGFTVITVTGPIERSVLVESTHARREDNMWGFAKAALDLLLECVESTPMSSAPDEMSASSADSALLCAQEDRYGGVEIEVPESARSTGPLSFQHSLRRRIQLWVAAGKRGLWLKLPLACSHFVGMACDEGFSFHHAQPGYVLLTRWLPPDMASPLPSYAFTQIGVGGVVVNTAGEVLMVKERVSPVPLFQGCWKLPGGLADPGEGNQSILLMLCLQTRLSPLVAPPCRFCRHGRARGTGGDGNCRRARRGGKHAAQSRLPLRTRGSICAGQNARERLDHHARHARAAGRDVDDTRADQGAGCRS